MDTNLPSTTAFQDPSTKNASFSTPGPVTEKDGWPETVFKAAPAGLYVADKGLLVWVTDWLAELLGYESPEDLKNLPFERILHPEDLEKVKQVLSSPENVGGRLQLDVRAMKKDGSSIWVSLRENRVRPEDDTLKIGRLVEITPVKQLIDHQRQLNAIFGKVRDSVIMMDAELRVISINSSTRAICGIHGREVIGRALSDIPSRCSKACCEVLNQVVETRVAVKDIPVECRAEFNPRQVVSVNSSPFLDPDGRFVGAVLVAKDITLLKNIEKQLEERHQFQNIIGKSKRMQDIYKLLEDLSNLETTVLLTGESGTGKELMARALHFSGKRASKPFIAVNCSALTEGLLESELFGHVKGAFTGAVTDKIGRFQAADGGTLLLDEIGDISPLIQLKLLRVLQEKEFERVGESLPRKVDVRVIACTNKDLKAKVKTGEFREDLYYRLKVVEVPLPPLRERIEDVPLLVNHACNLFNKIFNKSIQGISPEVLTLFMEYSWPGNVRELKHAIEHAFVLCHDKIIQVDHLPREITHFRRPARYGSSQAAGQTPNTREDILGALNKAFWNKTLAAQHLGISRQTLYRKIREHSLVRQS